MLGESSRTYIFHYTNYITNHVLSQSRPFLILATEDFTVPAMTSRLAETTNAADLSGFIPNNAELQQ